MVKPDAKAPNDCRRGSTQQATVNYALGLGQPRARQVLAARGPALDCRRRRQHRPRMATDHPCTTTTACWLHANTGAGSITHQRKTLCGAAASGYPGSGYPGSSTVTGRCNHLPVEKWLPSHWVQVYFTHTHYLWNALCMLTVAATSCCAVLVFLIILILKLPPFQA